MTINKNVNDASKRIQSAVKKKEGISLYLPDVRAIYEVVVKNWEKPTQEEIEMVTEKALAAFHQSEETAIIPQTEVIDITKENNPDVWEALEPEEDVIAPNSTESDTETLAPVEQTDSLESINTNEDESVGGLATTKGYSLADTNKHSLIQKQVAALSVNLSTSELTTVAGQIADNYTSFEEACQRIKSIILMVLNQRHERATDVLNDTLLTIVNHVAGDFQSLNSQASQGFNLIAEGLKQGNTDFKSKSEELESSLKQYLLK
jgi:hypothetical protein